MATTYDSIATQTLGSAAASVTFSSIPSTYTDLVLIGNIVGVSTATGVGMRFNADTTNNYSMTGMGGDGSSAQSFRQSNIDYIRFSYVGTYRTTNQGMFELNVQSYTNTNIYKTQLSRNSVASDGTEAEVGTWRSAAAIDNISIIPTNGAYTFSAGSTFTLYGIKAA